MIMKAKNHLTLPPQPTFRAQLSSLCDPYWSDDSILDESNYLVDQKPETVYNTLQVDINHPKKG